MVVNKLSCSLNKPILRQLLLTSVGLCQGISTGGIFGFSSVLFKQIIYDNSIILNENEESWFASVTTLIMFPTCLISGIVLEKFGRKTIIAFAELMALTGWIIIFFAYNYTMLISARILLGIFAGVTFPAVVAFIGEISMPQFRSMFITSIPTGGTVGTFVCQLLGDYVHWKIVAAVFALISLYNLVILTSITDSYVTYLDKNKIEKAQKAFQWYRGKDESSKVEFAEILEEQKKKRKESFIGLFQMCKTKEFLVPLGITILVFLTNEVTATQAVIFYTSTILKMIKNEKEFESIANLILNGVRIFSVILSLMLVKISSVRFILIFSGYLLGLSLLCTGLFMYLSDVYITYSIFPILSLGTIVLNAILFGVGLGPLPSAVCGEMFPPATRAIGGSISAAFSFMFLFIVVKYMPLLITSLGAYWTFAIFGCCTLIGITACHFVLPYTKNKTLQEINKLYQNNESKTNENTNVQKKISIATITV